jgi:asparagine synthase (glutamine-hydrolysing)
MCGIAGIIDFQNHFQIDLSLLQKMASSLQFRGPDHEGFAVQQHPDFQFGLAHKRLSIIDISNQGSQPMWSADNSVVIVFNGEIYNYVTLKATLQKEGRSFSTHSDTEVLLVAYQHWGIEQLMERIEGMFAFVLLDTRRQECFIVRDRFGEKPLYYYRKENSLVFSSDIRSFKALGIPTTIDHVALGYYFSELATPKDRSVFQEIKKVPSAHFIHFKKDHFEVKPYWFHTYKNKSNLSLIEAIDQTETLLNNAVQKALVSDVPVGCFLSGGVDSSLISWYAARNYGSQISTFSVGFTYEAFNELPYARAVAKIIGSKHHEIVLNPNDLTIVNALLEEYGEPFADSSAIPTYYVAKHAAAQVKVVLGGDGGDEIFGGYRTYNQGYRMQQWANSPFLKLPLKIATAWTKHPKAQYLLGILQQDVPTLASALYRNMGFSSSELKKLLHDEEFCNAPAHVHQQAISEALLRCDDVFDTLLHASINTRLVNDYLVKTDRATMFNSLELRTPFLDKSLVEFTSTLPYHYMMHKGINKYILKKIAEKYFSKAFIYRKKQGFGIPIGQWMRKEWKQAAKEVILQPNKLITFDEAYIKKIWDAHQEGQADYSHRLWALYVWNTWSEKIA